MSQIVAASPHVTTKNSTAVIMRDVLIALCPALIAGCVVFGLRALLVVAVTTAACIFFEWGYEKLCGKPSTICDLSAAVTGVLLAMNLPVSIPLWQAVFGALVAMVAVKGLFGKPTTENNVETFANIPQIILKGAKWFASMGTERSKGTKVFALGGKIVNTGLVEIPMGTTLREIIEDIGGGVPHGKKFKAAQTGGPSGGCIPASLIDTEIDYDNLTAIGCMMGSGGLIVMDEDNCMVDIAKFFLNFTVDESCGKCAPCRIGTKRMMELLEKITDGKGTLEDIDRLEELAYYIKENSLCGLGQTAPNPVLATLKFFRDEYVAHVVDKRCPAGVCKKLLNFSIDPEKCKGCTLCARKCPVGAISGTVKNPRTIDTTKCIKCGACMDNCKFGAISKG